MNKEFDILAQVESIADIFWNNPPVKRGVREASEVAKFSWKQHELGKTASLEDKVALTVLADELLYNLAINEYPGKPYQGVSFDKTKVEDFGIPKVKLLGTWEGAERFWDRGELASISFETNPNLSSNNEARRRKWLVIQGYDQLLENQEEHWEIRYELSDFDISKKHRRFTNRIWEDATEEVFERSDVVLVGTILNNMLSAMEEFRPLIIEENDRGFWVRES